jgi:hypothetical protein
MQARDRPPEPHSVQDTLFGQPTIADVTLRQQIACIKRELHKRGEVYPRLVARGKMTQGFADLEVLRMQAALNTLEKLEDSE